MRFVDYLALLRQRAGLVAIVVAVVGLASVGINLASDPVYEGNVRIRVRPPAVNSPLVGVLESARVQNDMGTESELVRSTAVGATVAERLGLDVLPEDLIQQVSALPVGQTAILVITARANTGEDAVRLANAFADAYLEARRADAAEELDFATQELAAAIGRSEQRLADARQRLAAAPAESPEASAAQAEIENVSSQIILLRSQAAELQDRGALATGFGEVIQPATSAVPVRTTSPARSLVFGILLGIPLALAAVLLLDALSDTVRDVDEAESLVGAEVLGAVPDDPDIDEREHPVTEEDPFSVTAEAYRTFGFNLATAARNAEAHVILLTGPAGAEGRSTALANLARAHAERGQPLVLVDADLRRPGLHELLGTEAGPGVAEILAGKRAGLVKLDGVVALLPAGHPMERPDRLLGAEGARRLVQHLRRRSASRRSTTAPSSANGAASGMVVLDGPPILQAAEASALAHEADGVVLAVRVGQTGRRAAVRAAAQVRRSGGKLLGILVVGVAPDTEFGAGDLMIDYGQRLRRLVARVPFGAGGRSRVPVR